MIEEIHKESEWWLNEPKKLVAYLYWLRGKIPNAGNDARDEIATQLNKKYPCPEEYKSKWGLQ